MADHLLVGDDARAVPLANEALALARQTGAPALIATGLLALGAAVAETDPEQARACLRESRELSTALGYQSALDLNWAATIAFLVGDQAAALELGRRAIHGLQWGGDRIRVGLVLHMIAVALAATRPDAAAIIQGAAEAYAVGPAERLVQLSNSPGGSSGRRARAGTPCPRRGHGLGQGHRLHPHPDHPGPQRTPIQDPAISELRLQSVDSALSVRSWA